MDEPIDESVNGINYTVNEEGTLTVYSIHDQGELTFKCIVWNEAGQDTASYIVKVKNYLY